MDNDNDDWIADPNDPYLLDAFEAHDKSFATAITDNEAASLQLIVSQPQDSRPRPQHVRLRSADHPKRETYVSIFGPHTSIFPIFHLQLPPPPPNYLDQKREEAFHRAAGIPEDSKEGDAFTFGGKGAIKVKPDEYLIY